MTQDEIVPRRELDELLARHTELLERFNALVADHHRPCHRRSM